MKVLLLDNGSFSMSDEAVERLIELGMPVSDSDVIFEWGENAKNIGRKYGVRDFEKSFRCDERVHRVFLEMGCEKFFRDEWSHSVAFIIDIPFDSLDGWCIKSTECSNGEYISECHRIWYSSETGETETRESC